MKKIYILMIAVFLGGIAKGQWQQCNGPYTGKINCFTSSSNIIFAGSSNGIYKSYNEGQTWAEVSNGLTQKSIYSLCALGTKIFALTADSGIFVSSNMGSQWMPLNNLPKQNISSIVSYNSKLYVSVAGVGIYYSQDTSSTWSTMNTNGLYSNISGLAINDTAIFAATSSGLYQSYDNGTTWQQSALPMTGLSFGQIKAKGSTIAAISGNGVFISKNNGQSWSAANNDSLIYWPIYAINLTDNYIFIGTIYNGLLRSSDNGLNWEHINSGINSYSFASLFIKDSVLYAGSYYGGGVYKSVNNGISWVQSNNGINNSYVYSISGSGNNVYAVNWDDGLYKSTDNCINWSPLNTSMKDYRINRVLAKANYVFALTDYGIFRSDDYGNNWTKNNNGIDSAYSATCIITSGNHIIAGREWGGGIFSSNNNGSNWILSTSSPESQYYPIRNFTTNGDTIYALTLFGILKSNDNGLNWVSIFEDLMAEYQMEDICISGGNIIMSKYPMIYIPGYSYGWYGISNDNGNTWTDLLIAPSMPAIVSMVSNYSFVFAATNRGIFMSTDYGNNWIDITDNISNINTNKVIINENYLIVSTNYGAMYRRPLSDFVGIVKNTASNYLSIFPNPATNTLTLNLSQLQKLQNATVSIYDIQGKQLLQKSITEAQTQIDISSFAKGIYIVKLQTDKETLQSKFVKE